MRFSTLALSLFSSTSFAAYTLQDDYAASSFASMFNFFTDNDPTNGYVNYVSQAAAEEQGLYKVEGSKVYMGVDKDNVASGRGRNSVRITSKKSYNHGLFILDLANMPGGACGTWPAFWLLGSTRQWPDGGEVDIIEGVNTQNYNSMAIHTKAGCSITNTGLFSGDLVTPNCDIHAAGQGNNVGCAIHTKNTQSYGSGFNAAGGGVYATEWTSEYFAIWFWPKGAVPADVSSGNPNPSNWGLPMARFAGNCELDDFVFDQQIIFDITFCGDWAGAVWGQDSTCSAKANSCQDYVKNNPSAFSNTYWLINSLKVFQNNGATPPPSSTSQSAMPTTTVTPPTSTMTTISTTIITTQTLPPVPTTTAIVTTTSSPSIPQPVTTPQTSVATTTTTTTTASFIPPPVPTPPPAPVTTPLPPPAAPTSTETYGGGWRGWWGHHDEGDHGGRHWGGPGRLVRL